MIEKFTKINTIEGYSYLLLMFVAMPLKYIFAYPIATKVVGSIHGLLFAIFLIYLALSIFKYKFDKKFSALLFIASLVPFGTFYTTKKLVEYKSKLNIGSN